MHQWMVVSTHTEQKDYVPQDNRLFLPAVLGRKVSEIPDKH